MENIVKLGISKRNVTDLCKRIQKNISNLNNIDDVCTVISETIPDAQDFIIEDNSLHFTLNRTYESEIPNLKIKQIEDFDKLLSLGNVNFSILNKKDSFELEAYVSLYYANAFGDSSSADIILNKICFLKNLSCRQSQIESILKDILGLSSGTVSVLLSEAKLGDISKDMPFIEYIVTILHDFTEQYILSTSTIPECWQDCWDLFKKEVDLKNIAKEKGYSDKDIIKHFDILEASNQNIDKYIKEIKSKYTNGINVEEMPLKDLKKLVLADAYDVLIFHCSRDNESGINKVLKTIDKISNDEFGCKFYTDKAERVMKLIGKEFAK